MVQRFSPREFSEKHQSAHARVFTQGRLDIFAQSPFAETSWEVFLRPHELNMRATDVQALGYAASQVGDGCAIISGESYAEFDSVMVDFEPRSFDKAYSEMICIVDNPHLFGPSASWGLFCTHDDYSLLAGVPEFMDAFASRFGGREGVRADFFEAFAFTTAALVGPVFGPRLLELAHWSV